MEINKNHHSLSIISMISFLLTSLFLVNSTAKRFDITNDFGEIEDFDGPGLIEVNNVDLIETKPALKPGKPKPEFILPPLPQFPQNFGLTSTWSLGSSLGSNRPLGLLAVQQQQSQNSPASETPAAPVQTQVSPQGQNYARPPASSPVISSNSINESPHVPPTWATQPQQPPSGSSQPSWTAQAQPQQPVASSPVFLQQPPQYSQSQPSPSYEAPSQTSQSQEWSVQTPSASAQSPSWLSQPTTAVVQSPPSSPSWTQSPPAPVASQPPPQQQQPIWLSEAPYSPQSSKPFSLYEQLNLHLLEPHTWEKLHDQNRPSPQSQFQIPQQSQQLTHQEMDIVLIARPPTATNNYVITSVTNNTEPAGNNLAILGPLDGIGDYILPGQSQLPQYSNSDITLDDDKFFDNDDDFVGVNNDEDEIMEMVE